MFPHRGLALRGLRPNAPTRQTSMAAPIRPPVSSLYLKWRPYLKRCGQLKLKPPRNVSNLFVSCKNHSLLAQKNLTLDGQTFLNDSLYYGSRQQLRSSNSTGNKLEREGRDILPPCDCTIMRQPQDYMMGSRKSPMHLFQYPPTSRLNLSQELLGTVREARDTSKARLSSKQASFGRLAYNASSSVSRYSQYSIANRSASKQAASNIEDALSTRPDTCNSMFDQRDATAANMGVRAQGGSQVSRDTMAVSTLVPSEPEGAVEDHAAPLQSSGLDFQRSQELTYPDLSRSTFVVDHGNATIARISPINADVAHERDETLLDGAKDQAASAASKESGAEHLVTRLGFCIPDHLMDLARKAPKGSERSYWQHSLYRGPGGNQRTKVHYCKSKDAMEAVSQLFASDKILGFDIEWMASARSRTGIRRNVALIQLANEERIGLFHLARFPRGAVVEDFVAPTFKAIMESADVTKVGVAIKGDSTRLRKFLGVDCRGIFELSHLYKVVRFYSGQAVKLDKRVVSLALQVEEHLGLPLLKTGLQTSDWSKELDYRQSRYAASDSYAGLQLYHTLEAKRLAIKPTPPRPVHAELNESFGVPEEEEAAMSDGESDVSDDSFKSIENSEDASNEADDLDVALSGLTLEGSSMGQARSDVKPCSPASSGASAPMDPSTLNRLSALSKQYDMAQDWATLYRANRSGKVTLALAPLRAYHVWYHQELDVPEIAMTLRNPPLKFSTVIEYLCEAVDQTSLPADQKRLAKLSTYGIIPHKKSHQRLLQSSGAELEQKT